MKNLILKTLLGIFILQFTISANAGWYPWYGGKSYQGGVSVYSGAYTATGNMNVRYNPTSSDSRSWITIDASTYRSSGDVRVRMYDASNGLYFYCFLGPADAGYENAVEISQTAGDGSVIRARRDSYNRCIELYASKNTVFSH